MSEEPVHPRDPTPDQAPDPEEMPHDRGWRDRLNEVIFGVDTPAGRAFDVVLLWCILLSVIAVMLDSVERFNTHAAWGTALRIIEWFFTVLFTIEYIIRLMCVRHPLRYARSFFGIVDLMAILPTYIDLLIPGTRPLLVIRAIRLLRIFRVLKLLQFTREANTVMKALHNSRRKITVFVGSVLVIALIMGATMYLIEGEEAGFDNIPISMYWAVVTLTTVGFGDITPQTTVGQMLAGALMIIGYSIIAVPTGIVSVEMAEATRADRMTARSCPGCTRSGHDDDARHCKHCGEELG